MDNHPTNVELALLWAANGAGWVAGHFNSALQGLVLLATLILTCLRIYDHWKGKRGQE